MSAPYPVGVNNDDRGEAPATPARRAPHLDTLSGAIELELPEFADPPAEPFLLLQRWVADAVRVRVSEPFSVALATADRAGRPSNRTVLVKSLDASGLMFVTDGVSAKGLDLAENPFAAVVAYWRETRQQLRVSGPVQQLSEEESDALFAVRPVSAQASAAASRQSRPLEDYAALQDAASRLARPGIPLPRPESWHGYRIIPETIEFWHGRTDRLHRRLVYRRGGDGWTHELLYP
jgi:pyridoxamine-phosphate oxidase